MPPVADNACRHGARGIEMTPRTDGWNNVEAPEVCAIVRVIVSDDRGEYVLPFAVVFRDDDWFNASTREKLSHAVHVEDGCRGARN
jgi:hypothetical protein